MDERNQGNIRSGMNAIRITHHVIELLRRDNKLARYTQANELHLFAHKQ